MRTQSVGTFLILQLLAAASAANAQGLHACSLVSEADIQRITGKANPTKVPPSRSEAPGGRTQCNYVGLDIAVTPGVTAQNFETNRKAAAQQRNTTTEAVAGLGEEAYYLVSTRPSSSNVGVVFRVGTYQVALGDRVPSDSVASFKPKVAELAKIAAAKLR
jgi:hypothetical protein